MKIRNDRFDFVFQNGDREANGRKTSDKSRVRLNSNNEEDIYDLDLKIEPSRIQAIMNHANGNQYNTYHYSDCVCQSDRCSANTDCGCYDRTNNNCW